MAFDYKKLLKPAYVLVAIVFVGAVLRLWGLGTAELFHDEGFYAFRSVGYLDYIQNEDQTTPVQWFRDKELPWWTKLSFHDHPPLFFLFQRASFALLGDTLFAARLPSALFGTLSILMIYFLARRLIKNETGALLSASLLALNHIHVWVSRSSLMEATQIFFILLNIYLFFAALENKKFWFLWGATLGAVALAKYTGFFLVPAYIVYLLWSEKDVWRQWEPYAGLAVAALVFSPVIVYNVYLYKTLGHLDLQLAYLFGQETPEWRVSLGKVQEPFSKIGENITAMYSIPFLVAVFSGVILSVYLYRRGRSNLVIFGWSLLAFITATLVAVGSAYRFIALYAAAFVFFVLLFLNFLYEKIAQKTLFFAILPAFLILELLFTVGGVFVTFPDFGVAKLDAYLETVFGDTRPSSAPKSPNPHLDKVIQEYSLRIPRSDTNKMIIYDENIDLSQRLWLFSRRLFYRGITSATAGNIKVFMRQFGLDYFKDYEFYFVKATPFTALNRVFKTPDADELEKFLTSELKLSPEQVIYGQNNLPMFLIYRYSLK